MDARVYFFRKQKVEGKIEILVRFKIKNPARDRVFLRMNARLGTRRLLS
jgi:hypothetical protein